MSQPESRSFSAAIGAIYDCVLAPDNWPLALEAVSRLLDSAFGFLLLASPTTGISRPLSQWGLNLHLFCELENEWGNRQSGLGYQHLAPLLRPFSLDHAAKAMQIQGYWDQPFFTEWARPSGFGDSANIVLVRTEQRVLTLVMVAKAHEHRITPEHLEILGELAPHLHRAITLGDYINRQNLCISSYERLLDSLDLAIVFMDGRGGIRHANQTAQKFFDENDGLGLADGRIRITSSEAVTATLHQAIRRVAGQSRASLLESVPVMMRSGDPAVAYVLPLDVPGGQQPPGVHASVGLILCSSQNAQAPVQALASLYGLTEAESRVLTHISRGRNRSQTAIEMQIADSTVKSHLQHIFEKTGMTSQAELIHCFTRLAAPVRNA